MDGYGQNSKQLTSTLLGTIFFGWSLPTSACVALIVWRILEFWSFSWLFVGKNKKKYKNVFLCPRNYKLKSMAPTGSSFIIYSQTLRNFCCYSGIVFRNISSLRSTSSSFQSQDGWVLSHRFGILPSVYNQIVIDYWSFISGIKGSGFFHGWVGFYYWFPGHVLVDLLQCWHLNLWDFVAFSTLCLGRSYRQIER